MYEALTCGAYAAEVLRLHVHPFTGTKGQMLTQLEEQVMVERQKKLVQELQTAQQALTADVKDKVIAFLLSYLNSSALWI